MCDRSCAVGFSKSVQDMGDVSSILFRVMMVSLLLGCSSSNGGQNPTTEHDQKRIYAAIEAASGFSNMSAFAAPKFAQYRQQWSAAARTLSTMTSADLKQVEVVCSLLSHSNEKVYAAVHWIANEPEGRFIRIASRSNSVILPLSSYNVDANDVDAAQTVLFYAESTVGPDEREWDAITKIVHGSESIRIAILDERELSLGELAPAIVDADAPDERAVLTVPEEKASEDHPVLAAVFNELPEPLRPAQWEMSEAGERKIDSWIRENIIGRRIELEFQYESIEWRGDEIGVKLSINPGSGLGQLNGSKIYITHIGIGQFTLPFDSALFDEMTSVAEREGAVRAVFDVDFANVYYNESNGMWGFDIDLSSGALSNHGDS